MASPNPGSGQTLRQAPRRRQQQQRQQLVTLDGSTLEGGGQLARVALTLSAVFGIPVRIENVRGGRTSRAHSSFSSSGHHRGDGGHGHGSGSGDRKRYGQRERKGGRDHDRDRESLSKQGGVRITGGEDRPRGPKGGGGLKESHLAALNFLAGWCGGGTVVYGAEVGSTEVEFWPAQREEEEEEEEEDSSMTPGKGSQAEPRMEEEEEEEVVEEEIRITLKRPGSVWLIWQAIMPVLLFGERKNNGKKRRKTGEEGGGGAAGPGKERVRPSSSDASVLPKSESSKAETSATAAVNTKIENPTRKTRTIQTIILRGGTNVPLSMSSEYVTQVFLPTLRRLNILPQGTSIDVEVVKRGWASPEPEIGEVRIRITSELGSMPDASKTATGRRGDLERRGEEGGRRCLIPPFQAQSRGSIERIEISVIASPESSRARLVELITRQLASYFSSSSSSFSFSFSSSLPFSSTSIIDPVGPEIRTALSADSEHAQRLFLLLVAHTSTGYRIGRDYLGSGRRCRTEREVEQMLKMAAESVVRDLVAEMDRGGCVDEFGQDQWVVFQALSGGGRSVVDAGKRRKGRDGEGATLHTKTVRWVCEEMLGVRFKDGRHGNGGGGGVIGVGFGGAVEGQEVGRIGDTDLLDVEEVDVGMEKMQLGG